jgi:hypothetical protein
MTKVYVVMEDTFNGSSDYLNDTTTVVYKLFFDAAAANLLVDRLMFVEEGKTRSVSAPTYYVEEMEVE